jgi:translation elongation factor EF-Tu-like GTPase
MSAFAFTDLLGPADSKPIRVLARISVLDSDKGGRMTPFHTRYRPNHNFGGPDDNRFYIGQVEFSVVPMIHPGEVREVVITFLNGPGLADLLQVGRRWRIQEGPKLVATGEVLQLLTE